MFIRPARQAAALVAICWICAQAAQAQRAARRTTPRPESESFIRQQQNLNERLREQRREMMPIDALLDWQWGGWIDYYVFHFDDGQQRSRLFQRPGLALWTHVTADDGAHEAFARVRLTFNHFKSGDEIDRKEDWDGPDFDRAWYRIDLGRATRLIDPSDPFQMAVKIGRQEVRLGTGYALDMPLDAVTIDAQLHDFNVRGLFARTIASTSNVDRSPAVADHSFRNFFGVEVRYRGFQKHEPFAYALWNQDHTDERPQDPLQNYSYDTRYFGIGSRGALTHNLNYWAEAVYESGHSFGNGMIHRRDTVEAFGLNAGLEYLWDRPTHPRVAFEYMFAGGDGDRLASPTGAIGGNLYGKDHSFVAFGYRDTGLAASPALSNIHIWKFGGSFQPFAGRSWYDEIELGSNWFIYHKNRDSGAISDPAADNRAGYVGWEMDYFVNWRFASDLSWTVRYGVFLPGNAFSDRSARHFVFSGITWSF